jgi:hypothetical protein
MLPGNPEEGFAGEREEGSCVELGAGEFSRKCGRDVSLKRPCSLLHRRKKNGPLAAASRRYGSYQITGDAF